MSPHSRPGIFNDHPARNRLLYLVQAGMLGMVTLLALIAGWHKRWIVDDGFIYLRVVDQITSGNGPVFNVGERVEAFTGPVWLALLTLAEVSLPLPLEWIAVILGIVCAVAGITLAMAGSAMLVRQYAPDTLLLPFGILVPLSLVVAWVYMSSGLESGLVVAWLGGCLFILARWSRGNRSLPWYGAVVIGLGWLIRPELALYSALFLAAVLALQWPRDTWHNRIATLAAALALPVLYQIWRMGYYGAVIANSAIAKDASHANWALGLLYLMDLLVTYWLWAALLVIMLGGFVPMIVALWRPRAWRALIVIAAFVLGGLLNMAYITGSGGDWLHGRLLLPALYALVMPVAVVPLHRWHLAALLVLPWAGFCLAVFNPEVSENRSQWRSAVTLEDVNWGPQSTRMRQLQEPGFYFDRGWGANFTRIELTESSDYISLPAAAVGGLGASGYALGPGWHIIDLWGLAHPLTARLISTQSMVELGLPGVPAEARLPGHDKPLPNVWLAALITPEGATPEADVFPQRKNPLIPHTAGEQFRQQVDLARRTLQCPPLQELYQAITTPMGPQRFIDNIAGAWSRTWLAIPPDPAEAHALLCDNPPST